MPFVVLTLAGNANSLPLLIQAAGLCEIHDVDLNAFVSKVVHVVIADAEVKPLVVAPRVRVNSHVAVILPLRTLNNVVKITRFKVSVEFQLPAVNKLWVHSGKLTGLFLFQTKKLLGLGLFLGL